MQLTWYCQVVLKTHHKQQQKYKQMRTCTIRNVPSTCRGQRWMWRQACRTWWPSCCRAARAWSRWTWRAAAGRLTCLASPCAHARPQDPAGCRQGPCLLGGLWRCKRPAVIGTGKQSLKSCLTAKSNYHNILKDSTSFLKKLPGI